MDNSLTLPLYRTINAIVKLNFQAVKSLRKPFFKGLVKLLKKLFAVFFEFSNSI